MPLMSFGEAAETLLREGRLKRALGEEVPVSVLVLLALGDAGEHTEGELRDIAGDKLPQALASLKRRGVHIERNPHEKTFRLSDPRNLRWC